MERKSSGSGLENREYGRRDQPRWPRDTLYPQEVGTKFADKRQSLGRYSSLKDKDHGVSYSTKLDLIMTRTSTGNIAGPSRPATVTSRHNALSPATVY
jgi:hypothetical protein